MALDKALEAFMFCNFPKNGWMALAGLLVVSAFVLAWTFPTFPGDQWALAQFQALETPWLTAAALAVTSLGRTPVALATVIVTVLALAATGRRRSAVLVTLVGLLVLVGNALKLAVGRPRPEFLLAGPEPHGLSFPSGHAVYAALFGGVLILLAEEHIKSPLLRRSAQLVLLLLILAVGASRVYLGVHWPSDVIGGYLFGLAALLGLTWAVKRLLNW